MMSWWNRLKRKDDTHKPDEQPAGSQEGVVGRSASRRSQVDLSDPAVRERRRQRLERRVKDLTFDIERSEAALADENRWSERVAEIDRAIDQARKDTQTIVSAPADNVGVTLAPNPVTIEHVYPGRTAEVHADVGEELAPGDPADIRFLVGDVPFRYAEEIDWSERGHTRTETQLHRVEGDINRLIPGKAPEERRDELREHLAHSLSTFAEHLQENAFANKPQPHMTLGNLAQPCPECGGWKDWKGRCPACQRRQWEAQNIESEIERLMDERNHQMEEARRWRERLPILRRQLDEARKDLARYEGE
ncbi:MAG: hypothetical protein H0V47_10590 [Chloroflexia bacterium]|nr:hypothetical protein [Chloroflexia bacterium]